MGREVRTPKRRAHEKVGARILSADKAIHVDRSQLLVSMHFTVQLCIPHTITRNIEAHIVQSREVLLEQSVERHIARVPVWQVHRVGNLLLLIGIVDEYVVTGCCTTCRSRLSLDSGCGRAKEPKSGKEFVEFTNRWLKRLRWNLGSHVVVVAAKLPLLHLGPNVRFGDFEKGRTELVILLDVVGDPASWLERSNEVFEELKVFLRSLIVGYGVVEHSDEGS